MEKAREPSLRERVTGEEGQGLVEYALILTLVAVTIVGSLAGLRAEFELWFASIAAAIP